ncbi:aldehyde dehydrogenase [Acetobacter estunensis NRIC 0472]|uniref:Aldehyde dehydrogenase family protein n=1 Tax=Acetobacter estunensis TaxID=104097 RepID=A0A967ECD2_9PROT|nr:NAD-dependent succinate-semialdehyde dehydrogenase [Acetobacter estunensis]NHO54473.1 aldehyde dehydrogenase family protein [Acetobacter estunensis]GBQ21943.1 aldehyde dehydrogenase [Acetobacter estunensis NRIC 0472]
MYQTINPSTGKVEKTFELHTDAQMLAKLEMAHTLWRDDWQHRPLSERKALLLKVAELLKNDREAHAHLIGREMGKVFEEALGEIDFTVSIFTYYAENAERILAPKDIAVDSGKATVVSQSLGVIYAVEPWNYPYYQLARVAAPNLMCGNTVMIKHAPGVPQCAVAFEKLFRDAGAPEGAYTNLFLTNEQSEALIGRMEVRGVALTGSERAGSAVASQAGKALKKSTMELGGADAFIVLDDADLDAVIPNAVYGRYENNGQVCTSAKRMIVHESIADDFTIRLKNAISEFRYGAPDEEGVTHGPMSSEAAMNRTIEQVDQAVKGGATVVTGIERLNREGFFLRAGILTNVTKDNPVYYQEIFGPVAIIHRVKSDEEAIALANDSLYGLGGSVYTRDVKRGRAIAEKVETGMIGINALGGPGAQLPFGGVKNSGYGRELGEFGIEEFINRKLIYQAD